MMLHPQCQSQRGWSTPPCGLMSCSKYVTISGRSSVTAMFWGKVLGLLGRSTVILLSLGKCEERKEWMDPKTLSCLSLYRLLSRGTVQWLSTWCKVCSLLQSWHCGDDNFFHRNRFLLCGNVSVTALSVNLKALSAGGGGGTALSCPSLEVLHSLALNSQTCTVDEPGCIVCCLHFVLDLGGELLLGNTRVISHHISHLLKWVKGKSSHRGLPQCLLGAWQ